MMPYRLGTVLLDGAEVPVVQHSRGITRLTDIVSDVPHSLLSLFEDWDRWRRFLAAEFGRDRPSDDLDLSTVRFLPPITAPRKLICIGTNYHDHVREMRVQTLPEFPYAFLRPATCLAGHGEVLSLPEWPQFVDWEAELGIIIGRRGRDLGGAAAMEAIAGYTIINDVSARDWIESAPSVGIDWVMQKAWDRFQPTGPWITPSEFIVNPNDLRIWLMVNGVMKQDSSTSQMIFGVEAIVGHLSRIMTLEPGDIIATGTPAGVGFGARPRERLRKGDVVRVGIDGVGTLENRIE